MLKKERRSMEEERVIVYYSNAYCLEPDKRRSNHVRGHLFQVQRKAT